VIHLLILIFLTGADGIWALGDCSSTNYPATAQVAGQEGRYLGKLFNNLSEENQNEKSLEAKLEKFGTFSYHHFGTFAYVGGHKAVAEFDRSPENKKYYEGIVTWVLWRSVYMSRLLSLRNRLQVAFDWAKTAVFGRDVSRFS
jgi:NADH:ubiquinone reductase (non-electrogenic)